MYLLAALIFSSLASAADFNYVAVNGCSGVIAKAPGASSAAPALVFTNGHCLDFRFLFGGRSPLPPATESYRDITAPSFVGHLNLSVQSTEGRLPLRATRVVFASMQLTDIAILELDQSYQELGRQGVSASLLRFTPPAAGTAVAIQAGYFNRLIACSLGASASLREGSYRWPDSLRFNPECEIYPGVSGAPVVVEASQEVVALANTHYSGSGPLCSHHNPCEVGEDGRETAASPGQSYGVSLAPFASCFNAAGTPQFHAPACPFHR